MQVAQSTTPKGTNVPTSVVNNFIKRCTFGAETEYNSVISNTLKDIKYPTMEKLIQTCVGYAENSKYAKGIEIVVNAFKKDEKFSKYFESKAKAPVKKEVEVKVTEVEQTKVVEVVAEPNTPTTTVAEPTKARKPRNTEEVVYVNLSTIAINQQFKYPTGNAVHTLVGKGKDTNTIIALRNGKKEWHRDLDINDDIVIALGFIEVDRQEV
jgi:hypothetical protein